MAAGVQGKGGLMQQHSSVSPIETPAAAPAPTPPPAAVPPPPVMQAAAPDLGPNVNEQLPATLAQLISKAQNSNKGAYKAPGRKGNGGKGEFSVATDLTGQVRPLELRCVCVVHACVNGTCMMTSYDTALEPCTSGLALVSGATGSWTVK